MIFLYEGAVLSSFEITKAKRIVAGIMCLMILLIMLSVSYYIASEVHHDCEGEDCPICAFIHQCETILSQFGDGTVLLYASMVPVFFILVLTLPFEDVFRPGTPVLLKDRLNN